MKNIVILVNGTWNDSGSDKQEQSLLTNVVWLRDLCLHDETSQVVSYMDGVGTGNIVDRALGGALGFGLTKGICEAYRAASEHYEPGDQIYFFGFSRGAYTVRTAAGMIAKIGLVDFGDTGNYKKDKICEDLFAVYRDKKKISELGNIKFHNSDTTGIAPGTTPVHLVGVWDTVGTSGIPDHYRLLNAFDKISDKHNWANTELSPVVKHGRHAIGMDEKREAFVPAFWTTPDDEIANDDRIKQLWFSGVHADVGGGYEKRDLGNIAMKWMVDEAVELGLLLKNNPSRPIPEERAMGVVNDSLQSVFKRMWTRPRGVPNVLDPSNQALFHPSVIRRYNFKERPSTPDWNALDLSPGQTVQRVAWAKDHWTPLRVFIEPDEHYTISAEGRWFDKDREYDAEGVWINKSKSAAASWFDIHKIPTTISRLATRKRHEDEYRRVWGAWRVPNEEPFVLMGVIADGQGVRSDENGILPDPHKQFRIGHGVKVEPGKDVSVERGGYLYCFPNDVWSKYANNSGSLNVTVERGP